MERLNYKKHFHDKLLELFEQLSKDVHNKTEFHHVLLRINNLIVWYIKNTGHLEGDNIAPHIVTLKQYLDNDTKGKPPKEILDKVSISVEKVQDEMADSLKVHAQISLKTHKQEKSKGLFGMLFSR